ncbi:McrC family protein [Chryseobacterium sp. NKUCC03_KSP]|uniref:McrC family protein n=1 Tax=Chryseobacterium sp. NKUCC03_KSP TaxID=2842125 RepID=UPI001C5A945F|nr:McrC family protein [Chryseobacterium sp. NKUCC03_KSP]
MTTDNKKYIEAKDCLPFTVNEEESHALLYFLKEVEPNILHFSIRQKEKEPLVYFDYNRRQWFANRYIGECEFVYNQQTYVLRITPRFGNQLLLKLFEYIYATKLPPSYHSLAKNKGLDIHKLLISIMWISVLRKALRHGLLKENRKIKEQGTTIRGKFLVRESLIDVKVSNTLSYEYTFKDVNNIPNQILYKAYQILKRDYFLSDNLLSNIIKSDLHKLSSLVNTRQSIKLSDYKKIRLNSMFKGYRAMLDLSWEIINAKELSIENSNSLGKSFFLDMAELWEVFVLKVISKNLIPEGWNILPNEHEIYKNTFYGRKLIPDIVIEKEDKILIIDAKYKKMDFKKNDVDRNDIFQIHTYSYYFDDFNKEVYSSLVYPIEKELYDKCNKQSIFNKGNHKNSFFIEGIEVDNSDIFDSKIIKFINSLIDKTSPK